MKKIEGLTHYPVKEERIVYWSRHDIAAGRLERIVKVAARIAFNIRMRSLLGESPGGALCAEVSFKLTHQRIETCASAFQNVI